jgi:hypothetical protein
VTTTHTHLLLDHPSPPLAKHNIPLSRFTTAAVMGLKAICFALMYFSNLPCDIIYDLILPYNKLVSDMCNLVLWRCLTTNKYNRDLVVNFEYVRLHIPERIVDNIQVITCTTADRPIFSNRAFLTSTPSTKSFFLINSDHYIWKQVFLGYKFISHGAYYMPM